MSIELYLDRNGEISGPYSPEELKQLAQAGGIDESDFIRKGEDGKPVRAARVKGLFGTARTEDLPSQEQQETEEPERERNIPVEILSRTGDGLSKAMRVTGSATAKIVAGMAKSRNQPTNQPI